MYKIVYKIEAAWRQEARLDLDPPPAKHGANRLPNDRSEISDARRSLLKMKPDYTVEFIWIMSKHKACGREDIEELIRAPSIRSLIAQHRPRIDELLRCFEADAVAPNQDPSKPARPD